MALSLISRPVGVTDHPVLRSPDFPPLQAMWKSEDNRKLKTVITQPTRLRRKSRGFSASEEASGHRDGYARLFELNPAS